MSNTTKNNNLTLEQQRFLQRKRIIREVVHLAVFAAAWIKAEDFCYSDAYRRKQCLGSLREILGGPDGFGWLQEEINGRMDGILERLPDDLGILRPEELLVFSHSAAGLTNDLSARLMGLSGPGAASCIRSRLRKKIIESESPNIDEYLVLLPKKGCRFGEEMLYLHNLKFR